MLQYRGPINTGPREDLLVVPPRLFCKARGQEMTNRSPQRCQLWSEPSLWSVVFHHVEERLHQRSYSLDMSGCQCVYPCISHRDGRRFGDVMTAPSVFLALSVCGAAVPLSGACYLFILAEVGAPLRWLEYIRITCCTRWVETGSA